MSKRPNALAKAIKKPDPKPAQANSEPAAPVKNALAVKTPSAAAAAAPAEQATPAVVLPPVSAVARVDVIICLGYQWFKRKGSHAD